MPWASLSQSRWGHSRRGRAQLGAATVREFDKATDWEGLPWRTGKQRRKQKGRRRHSPWAKRLARRLRD